MLQKNFVQTVDYNGNQCHNQPRTQGTFRNESTLVDRGHVGSLYCPDFGQ